MARAYKELGKHQSAKEKKGRSIQLIKYEIGEEELLALRKTLSDILLTPQQKKILDHFLADNSLALTRQALCESLKVEKISSMRIRGINQTLREASLPYRIAALPSETGVKGISEYEKHYRLYRVEREER